MGYDIPPTLVTGGHIVILLRMVVRLVRQRHRDGVHGMDEVHEQGIDVINDGQSDGDLNKTDHDAIPISFSMVNHRTNPLRKRKRPRVYLHSRARVTLCVGRRGRVGGDIRFRAGLARCRVALRGTRTFRGVVRVEHRADVVVLRLRENPRRIADVVHDGVGRGGDAQFRAHGFRRERRVRVRFYDVVVQRFEHDGRRFGRTRTAGV